MRFDQEKLKGEWLWLLVIFVAGLVWISGAFFANLSFPDSSYNFLGETKKAKLDPGKPVTQTFRAEENNLNQVKIMVGNTGLWPTERIVLELADVSCDTVLATETIDFLMPDPHIYYHFNFPAIPDSQGATYCLRTTYFSGWDRGDKRPYLSASEGESFVDWSYTNEGNHRTYENRTLQLRPAYGTENFSGDMERLLDRLSQDKPWFLREAALVTLFGVFLAGTFVLVFVILWSKERD